MKNLKTLYEENGSKGGFWAVDEGTANKDIIWVWGPSEYQDDSFVYECDSQLFYQPNDSGEYSLFKDQTWGGRRNQQPEAKRKMLAYREPMTGKVLVEFEDMDVPNDFIRLPFLDGEVE